MLVNHNFNLHFLKFISLFWFQSFWIFQLQEKEKILCFNNQFLIEANENIWIICQVFPTSGFNIAFL